MMKLDMCSHGLRKPNTFPGPLCSLMKCIRDTMPQESCLSHRKNSFTVFLVQVLVFGLLSVLVF